MSGSRSKSVPALRTVDRATDVEEETSVFPALPQELISDPRVPSWIQELANARAARHSRASSVVSTRTRFSTTTFDDAHSVDIQAGGQTFRISRYGDRVTDATAPPPYPGSHHDELSARHPDDLPHDLIGMDHEHIPRHSRQLPPPPPPSPHHHYHHHHLPAESQRRRSRRVRIAMPDEDARLPLNDDDDSIATDTPSRVITDEELRQIILDLPSRLQSALGINPVGLQANPGVADGTVSDAENVPPQTTESVEASSKVATGDSTSADRQHGAGQVRGILRNAPQSASFQLDPGALDGAEPHSIVPDESTAQRLWNTYKNARTSFNAVPMGGQNHDRFSNSSETLHASEELAIQPTVGDLNELSQVYNKVIRGLDREHRKQLHERDRELDELRILLHEKDVVYRQQLKGKDFVIDDLKQRLDHLEESMASSIEKAAHQVEDLWEARWKEHSLQLMEKCGLIKPTLQPYSSSGTQTNE